MSKTIPEIDFVKVLGYLTSMIEDGSLQMESLSNDHVFGYKEKTMNKILGICIPETELLLTSKRLSNSYCEQLCYMFTLNVNFTLIAYYNRLADRSKIKIYLDFMFVWPF